MSRFIIIDGNALLHRAWHAMPPLKTQEGKLINAAYGFTSILLKLIKDLKPTYLTVAFDLSAPTFRHLEYKEYKAKRVKQPEEFYQQIPIVKEVLTVLGIPIFEKAGFEADDLIGTVVSQPALLNKKIEVLIATGDLDTLQLVRDNVFIYTFKKGISDVFIYDRSKVKERFDLEPEQMIDYKALAGDSSDNIIGIRGIGAKSASKLLKEYKTLVGLYEALEKGGSYFSPKLKKLLTDGKESAFLSQKLATIILNVPIEFSLEKCLFKPVEKEKIYPLFQKYEFKSLLGKLFITDTTEKAIESEKIVSKTGQANLWEVASVKIPDNTITLENEKDWLLFKEKISGVTEIALTPLYEGSHFITAKLFGLGLAFSRGEEILKYYAPFNEFSRNKFEEILNSEKITKITHNLKVLLEILESYQLKLTGPFFDTMLAAYLLNPGENSHKLDILSWKDLGVEKFKAESYLAKGDSWINVTLEKIKEFIGQEVFLIFKLKSILLKKIIEREQLDLFLKLEMPLVSVLKTMEENGMLLNTDFLKTLENKLSLEIKDLETKIWELSGENFNINSPKQLREIIITKLQIPGKFKKGKTGLSMDADALEKIRGKHPIVDLVIRYRELAKLMSTYITALPELVLSKTGRIHTTFNQTVTATGRLSSSEPNLQNIPTRTILGKEIRKAFISKSGYKLVGADYSQIELRVVAALAGDEKMLEAFNKGADIHKITAAEIFSVKEEEVTSEMRSSAKAINFGVLYGQGPRALSESTGISLSEAKEFIARYFEIREKVKNYLEGLKDLARKQGYVSSLYGRRRYLPEINSKMPMFRAAAEGMAINMPVQGTAADLIKLAMIEIDKQIKLKFKPEEVKLLLQVHDELIFEVKEEKIPEMIAVLKPVMENSGRAEIKIPILVEIKTGSNWGEMEKYY